MSSIKVFNHHISFPVALLIIVEALICYLSLFAASTIRFYNDGGIQYAKGELLSIQASSVLVAVLVVIVMLAMGLYQAQRREVIWNVLNRITTAFIVASLVLSIIFFMFPDMYFGRGLFVLTLFISFIGIVFARVIFESWVDKHTLNRRVLVLGVGENAKWVNNLRRRADQRGISIVGFYGAESEEISVDEDRVISTNQSLDEYVLDNGVEEIVVAMGERRQKFPAKELINCRLSGVDVIELPTFLERQMSRVYVELLDPSWIIFSDGFRQNTLKSISTRAFDVLASLLMLILTMPLLIGGALAILIESKGKGTLFYKQNRVGQGNKNFELLKFRSMCENAEAGTGAKWASANDSRITRVGKVLRKYRIDELPQLINILKGEMSLVGPRPERPEFVNQLSEKIPFYSERHRVKPGLAGWAQMRYPYGSTENDAIEKLKYDLYYVKNSSLIFNLAILIQTAEIVLWGKGAR
ncbi:MAG: TIGR03013 family PEP-CTERM/XrtA system glycosyltransferase [Gammaproteobacteria bacterium]|nr:TIGR03013 family PEP-CTERM/XrtA system glycosyltransferase [Gammaproteobacteria bacterium]